MCMSSSGFNPQAAEWASLESLGGGLGQLFSDWQNPANSAMPYMQQAQNQLPGYFQPWMQAGQNQLGGLQQQYSNLMNNPGGMLNMLGSQYKQSPGYQFQFQQGMNGVNNAAAAGGMLGGSQAQMNAGQMATGLANQDYYNYLNKAMGMYGQGLQGAQGMANNGMMASMGLGEDMSSLLGSQAQLAYQGQNAQNQQQGGMWGSMLGGAASLLPFL